MLVTLKKASRGLALVDLKGTGCDVWQLECQASNVTAIVQLDHLLRGYMFPVFFATGQSHSTPCCAEIQPVSQQATASTRPYRWLLLHTHGRPSVCPRHGDRASR